MSSLRMARRSAAPRRGGRAAAAAAMACLAVAVAWLGTALALATAEGVTPVPGAGQTYDTEFIEGWVYVATAVFAVDMVRLAAPLWWPAAAVGWVGAVAALWWGGSETVARYVESGWSDGLEVFVYIVPMAAVMVGLLLLAPCSRLGRAGKSGSPRNSGRCSYAGRLSSP